MTEEATAADGRALVALVKRLSHQIGAGKGKLPFEAHLEEISWLSEGDGSIYRTPGPFTVNRKRAVRATLSMFRMTAVAYSLYQVLEARGADQTLKHAHRTPLTSGLHFEGQGGQRFFEIEVAAALRTALRLPAGGKRWPEQISLGAADVVFHQDDGPDIHLECKRPSLRRQILKRVRDAVAQIGTNPGVVILSLDTVMDPIWIQGDDAEVRTAIEKGASAPLPEELKARVREALPGLTCEEGTAPLGALGVLLVHSLGAMIRVEGAPGCRLRAVPHVTLITAETDPRVNELLSFTLLPMLQVGLTAAASVTIPELRSILSE